MKELNELLGLLKEKKECFVSFEQEADAMCSCPMEALEDIMQKRQKILDRVGVLDKRIQELCRTAGPEADAAIKNTCARGGLSANLAQLYDASMQVKGVISRIVENESMIRDRLETEKSILLQKIEKTQTGSMAAASRYSASVQTGVRSQLFSRELGKA